MDKNEKHYAPMFWSGELFLYAGLCFIPHIVKANGFRINWKHGCLIFEPEQNFHVKFWTIPRIKMTRPNVNGE